MSGEAVSGPAFRSPRCIVGRHDRCRDHVTPDSGVPGVRLLVCDCPCHAPGRVAADGDSKDGDSK